MEDFDIAQNKVGESAQRIVDRAVEESRRRDHAVRGMSTSSCVSPRSNGICSRR